MNSSNIDVPNNAEIKVERDGKEYIPKTVAVYLLSFMLLLMVLPFLAYFLRGSLEFGGLFKDDLIRHLFYIGSAGGLGGIVYCMRGFYEHKVEGNFDINYLSWYLFRPIISTIIGIIVFFLFAAHLIDATGFSAATPGDIMFSCSVAFLAGFGFTQFYGKIDDLANTLFKPKETKTNCDVTWTDPATPITYGTPLTSTQLNATVSSGGQTVPGTFVYTPEAGKILDAGKQILKVRFLPANPTKYIPQEKSVIITVNKETPEITWKIPRDITYGTSLTNTQLDAEAKDPNTGALVSGSFVYTPTKGTVLNAGTGQDLYVDFISTDPNYKGTLKDVKINVLQATPVISWNPYVTSKTPLPDPQECASASFMDQPVGGTFTCNQSGQTLVTGSHNVTVKFVPESSNFINPTMQQIKITVNEVTHTGHSELSHQTTGFDQD
jgi:hypothetical protein